MSTKEKSLHSPIINDYLLSEKPETHVPNRYFTPQPGPRRSSSIFVQSKLHISILNKTNKNCI